MMIASLYEHFPENWYPEWTSEREKGTRRTREGAFGPPNGTPEGADALVQPESTMRMMVQCTDTGIFRHTTSPISKESNMMSPLLSKFTHPNKDARETRKRKQISYLHVPAD